MTLLAILGATLAGGVLSVLIAALVSMTVLRRIAGKLVGFAVGVLLAAALLDLLPEALAELSAPRVGGVLLAGLLGFLFLEKLALWRHDHGSGSDATVTLIVLGDGVHNFVDGVLLAAAFLQDPVLGMTTAAAVIAHEIPQEIGDFMVLLAAGVGRARALALNALSGAAMVAGGVVGFAALQAVTGAVPTCWRWRRSFCTSPPPTWCRCCSASGAAPTLRSNCWCCCWGWAWCWLAEHDHRSEMQQNLAISPWTLFDRDPVG